MTFDRFAMLLLLASVPVTVVSGYLLWRRFQSHEQNRALLSAVMLAFGLLVFLLLSSYGILLRDGLAPDSVRSSGLLALKHCIPMALFASVASGFFGLLGWLSLRFQAKS